MTRASVDIFSRRRPRTPVNRPKAPPAGWPFAIVRGLSRTRSSAITLLNAHAVYDRVRCVHPVHREKCQKAGRNTDGLTDNAWNVGSSVFSDYVRSPWRVPIVLMVRNYTALKNGPVLKMFKDSIERIGLLKLSEKTVLIC